MEAENFEKVLLKESLHRSSQNNMNQAEAGYNAKWFRRGGLFALKWLQKRSYSEEDLKYAFEQGKYYDMTSFDEWFNEQFKNK
jgi:hypothetical protein